MPTDILMPALSPTMEEGKLSKWVKKEGDKVKSGDVLCEIETDKATMEVEAVDEGTLTKILVAEGTEGVKVNAVIAVLVGEGEDASAPAAAPAAKAEAAPRRRLRQFPPRQLLPRPFSRPPPIRRIPAGTEMVATTVREALRDAMAEEMRRDGDVFIMGEEVAEYQGAYKITQGLLAEFGPRRVVDTPITEHGFAGIGVGAAMTGLAADRRVHDIQLRHAGH